MRFVFASVIGMFIGGLVVFSAGSLWDLSPRTLFIGISAITGAIVERLLSWVEGD